MKYLFRIVCTFLFAFITQYACGQYTKSIGAFGGVNFPITLDDGLKKDPRFTGKLTFRTTPVGFAYGHDYSNIGFVVTPCYIQIGQQYIVNNINGGAVGDRDIRLDYLSIPAAFKLHVINFSFIRISAVAALSFNYLIGGKETLTFSPSTLLYPKEVHIPAESEYQVVPDGGVAVPEVKDLLYVSSDKFNAFQLFAGLGFRSDIDLSEKWDLVLDARINYGIFDPRKQEYINQLKASTDVPDLPGERRDAFLTIEIGISRIILINNRRTFKTSNQPIKNIRPKLYKKNRK